MTSLEALDKTLDYIKEQYGIKVEKLVFIKSDESFEIETLRKALKTLDILKNKKVNLEYIKSCENYEQYKTICSYWNEITEDEFDLLREVLNNKC